MSYPRDLDEYTDKELMDELQLRADCHRRGLCSYCRQFAATSPPCKFPNRHKQAEEVWRRKANAD